MEVLLQERKAIPSRDISPGREDNAALLLQVRESLDSPELIKNVLNNIKKKGKPTNEEITFFVTYLFIILTYKNWQHPGAAINLTLSEACDATESDGKLIVTVANHKISLTYGPAILVLQGEDIEFF